VHFKFARQQKYCKIIIFFIHSVLKKAIFCMCMFMCLSVRECVMMGVQRENEAHRKLTKGGAFRLNMAPRDYFDENPFKNDKPLPPTRKLAEKRLDLKPFKPSSPSKMVRYFMLSVSHRLKCFIMVISICLYVVWQNITISMSLHCMSLCLLVLGHISINQTFNRHQIFYVCCLSP